MSHPPVRTLGDTSMIAEQSCSRVPYGSPKILHARAWRIFIDSRFPLPRIRVIGREEGNRKKEEVRRTKMLPAAKKSSCRIGGRSFSIPSFKWQFERYHNYSLFTVHSSEAGGGPLHRRCAAVPLPLAGEVFEAANGCPCGGGPAPFALFPP